MSNSTLLTANLAPPMASPSMRSRTSTSVEEVELDRNDNCETGGEMLAAERKSSASRLSSGVAGTGEPRDESWSNTMGSICNSPSDSDSEGREISFTSSHALGRGGKDQAEFDSGEIPISRESVRRGGGEDAATTPDTASSYDGGEGLSE